MESVSRLTSRSFSFSGRTIFCTRVRAKISGLRAWNSLRSQSKRSRTTRFSDTRMSSYDFLHTEGYSDGHVLALEGQLLQIYRRNLVLGKLLDVESLAALDVLHVRVLVHYHFSYLLL